MSTDTLFTKENLNTYLKELGKEFRKLNSHHDCASHQHGTKVRRDDCRAERE